MSAPTPYSVGVDDRVARLLGEIRTGAWLNARHFPPLRYAVPGLIPEGLTLLIGPPKAGKSLLILDALLAVAGSGRALGSLDVGQARPVLYFALEDSDRRMQARIAALRDAGGAPELFEYLLKVNASDAVPLVGKWLDSHSGQDALIVIDTLGKIMPPAAPGESAYGRDYRIGGALKQVADDHPGTSLVLLHHDRKAVADDFVDSVSGTHGLAGAADTIVVLARHRNEQSGLLQVTGRDVPEAEYAVELTEHSGWRLVGSTLHDAARDAAIRKSTVGLADRTVEVVQEVEKHPDGIGVASLATATGIARAQIDTYLSRLVTTQRIRRVKRGIYAPVASPATGARSVRSVGSEKSTTSSRPNTSNTSNTGVQGKVTPLKGTSRKRPASSPTP